MSKVCSRYPFPDLPKKTNPEQIELYVTLEGVDKKLSDMAEYLNTTNLGTITWFAEDSETSKNLATCLARKVDKSLGASLLPPRVAMHIPMATIIVVDRLRHDNWRALEDYLEGWEAMPSLSGTVRVIPRVITLICDEALTSKVKLACYVENYSTKILTQLGLPL